MTSSVNKSSSIYSETYIYGDISDAHKLEKSILISDRVVLNKGKEGSDYHSHLERLFKTTTNNSIYVEPPFMSPRIQNRLFLPDIIRSYENLISCWESYLERVKNLPQNNSTETIRKLCKHMMQLSQISRYISNKTKYEFNKS